MSRFERDREESDRRCHECERPIARGTFCFACREKLFPTDEGGEG